MLGKAAGKLCVHAGRNFTMSTEAGATKGQLLNRLAGWYRVSAILLLNTILFFVVVNVLSHVVLTIREKHFQVAPPSDIYPEDSFAAVYPEFDRPEWNAMLKENWSRPYVFGGYLLFKEARFEGKYVNVSEAGFRKVGHQGPWPPVSTNFNVFVFGGSTMFGYGVADDQTFASYLQEAMGRYSAKRLCVYNFGAGYYYSTQERIFFERLLTHVQKPDIAMFVDGLNDLWHAGDEASFADKLAAAFDREPKPLPLEKLPVMQILRKLERKTFAAKVVPAAPADVPGQVQAILDCYRRNVRLIEAACREFGVTPVFVWQPIPSYKYDTQHHLFYRSPDSYQHQIHGYPEMARIYKEGALGSHFLWCADLQEAEKECLYVDNHHYTARFAKKLAEQVCLMCAERGLLKAAGLESKPVPFPKP